MTNTIHPWTMYEVARFRDDERMVRARDARLALRAKQESVRARGDTEEAAASRVGRIRHLSPLAWVHDLHLRPHHVRHT